MRHLTIILVAFCIFLNTASPEVKSVVSVDVVPQPKMMKAGTAAYITIKLRILSSYHINSYRPLDEYLIPTTVEFDPQPGVVFGKITFPPPTIRKLEISDNPMSLYEGTVEIKAEVTPTAEAAAKGINIAGRVRYQACDDRICLPPVRQAFNVRMAGGRSEVVQPAKHEESIVPSAKSQPGMLKSSDAGKPAPAGDSLDSIRKLLPVDSNSNNTSMTFFLVFLAGLGLNLTPCVYPMISITISYFGGQSKGKRGSMILHSLLYILGMAMMYSVLGVFAALTGGMFGGMLRYPAVLIGIAAVMILLALSMFEVFELQMPAFLNRLAGKSQKGFLGTFLMGLTVGIVAAPCVGPFILGLLTYVGNKGDVFLGFALFFVLALGLGVPFLVLGFFSGSIIRLPRSGAWMVWVRKIFGFILLVMAIFFLKSLFPNRVMYELSLALILLLAGIYLAWIESTKAGKTFLIIRNITGLIFIAASLYIAIGSIRGYIHESPQIGIPDRSTERGLNAVKAIRWLPYSEERLAQASREGRSVFIDFFADWCAPCKEMDKLTFSDSEVAALSDKFIMLKVDLTSTGDAQTESMREKYQVRGVPTYIFLKPDGSEIPDLRGTGFEMKTVFISKLKQALGQSTASP